MKKDPDIIGLQTELVEIRKPAEMGGISVIWQKEW